MIVIDGNDGTGKTTLVHSLRLLGFVVSDRGLPTRATDSPECVSEARPDDTYIILDVPVETSLERLRVAGKDMTESWHTLESLTHYRTRFRDVAGSIGAVVIDASGSSEDVLAKVCAHLAYLSTVRECIARKPVDAITQAEFDSLPLIVEGESKVIRDAGDDWCIIQYKPTVFSYTHNRAGTVEGSDSLRLRATRVFTDVLRAAGVAHAYSYVGKRFVVAERIRCPPPIEVVVKKFHMGTPRHRYHGMVGRHLPRRNGAVVDEGPYPDTMVRFDWRNPMWSDSVPPKMLCDEVLADDQADWYIDTHAAKATARRVFEALETFLAPRGVAILDLCLFIAENGRLVFGEISQDCGRFRKVGNGPLDKDVWRSGGSSALVVEKWTRLLELVE